MHGLFINAINEDKGVPINRLWVEGCVATRRSPGSRVCPEMRKLFLRISREDCQPLSAIASNHQPLSARIRKELTITYVIVCKRRNKA